MSKPDIKSQCEGCGSADKAPGAKYCPLCEQACADYEDEAQEEYERQMEHQRWVEEHGPDGHGW